MDLAEWHAQNPGKPVTVGEHGFGNNELWDSRGSEDRALVRLGPNVSQVDRQHDLLSHHFEFVLSFE